MQLLLHYRDILISFAYCMLYIWFRVWRIRISSSGAQRKISCPRGLFIYCFLFIAWFTTQWQPLSPRGYNLERHFFPEMAGLPEFLQNCTDIRKLQNTPEEVIFSYKVHDSSIKKRLGGLYLWESCKAKTTANQEDHKSSSHPWPLNPSGLMFYSLMNQKWNFLEDMAPIISGIKPA